MATHKAPLPVMDGVDVHTNAILARLNDLTVDVTASKAVRADALRTIIEVAASHLKGLKYANE